MTDHLETRATLRAWLFDQALPLWRARGLDPIWGFHESLDQRAMPTGEARRLRVQARQAYAYARAGLAGWPGPWKSCTAHGVAALSKYRRADGLYRTLLSTSGACLDDRPVLYDHAFVLLALWAAHVAAPTDETYRSEARALVERLRAQFGAAPGGFRELSDDSRLHANPHMHLLESCLHWVEYDPDGPWEALCEEIVDLARRCFFEPSAGALLEHVAADGSKLRDGYGDIIEPGHQYEWSWLFLRWAVLSGSTPAQEIGSMTDFAERLGCDTTRGVALDRVTGSGRVLAATARLWPQTERLRYARSAQIHRRDPRSIAMEQDASAAVLRYLDTPTPGLWRDRLSEDGSFERGPAPASSLYHLVGAILAS